jgi:hypothetical protein
MPGCLRLSESKYYLRHEQYKKSSMKRYFIVLNVMGLFVAALVAAAETPQRIATPKSIETFFKTYCYDCHDTETMKADLSLEEKEEAAVTGRAVPCHWGFDRCAGRGPRDTEGQWR